VELCLNLGQFHIQSLIWQLLVAQRLVPTMLQVAMTRLVVAVVELVACWLDQTMCSLGNLMQSP
jgi:hypothetical protein